MALKIGTNIRMLRTSKGLTQEKLAEHLGVSCQAVSKWESENGYPDIEFIPALAYYFNVTTDELLGVDASRNRQIIDGYMTRYIELRNDHPGQLALMREATAKFPNNFILLQGLMYSLIFNISIHRQPGAIKGMIKKTTALEEKPNVEFLSEAVTIAERILKDCVDDCIRHSAIQILCYYYPLIGKKEDAVTLAKSMPPLYISRNALLEEIYDGEAKIRQIQSNICSMTDYLCGDIVSLADPDCQQQHHIPLEEKIRYISVANSVYQLLQDNGAPTAFNDRLARNYRLMAALALLDGQTERALDCLERAADYAAFADAASKKALSASPDAGCADSAEEDSTAALNSLFYQNTVNNRIVLKIEDVEANASGFLLKKLEQSRYDVIRNDQRFKAIENKLMQYA